MTTTASIALPVSVRRPALQWAVFLDECVRQLNRFYQTGLLR